MSRLYAVVIGLLWVFIPTMLLAAQSNEAEEIEQWLTEQWDSIFGGDIGPLLFWSVVIAFVLLWARFRNVSQYDPTHPAPTRVHIDYGQRPKRRPSEQRRDENYSSRTRRREGHQSKLPPRPWG